MPKHAPIREMSEALILQSIGLIENNQLAQGKLLSQLDAQVQEQSKVIRTQNEILKAMANELQALRPKEQAG